MQIAPIYDGFVLEKGVRQVQLGGSDVTRQLAALVNAKVMRIPCMPRVLCYFESA